MRRTGIRPVCINAMNTRRFESITNFNYQLLNPKHLKNKKSNLTLITINGTVINHVNGRSTLSKPRAFIVRDTQMIA